MFTCVTGMLWYSHWYSMIIAAVPFFIVFIVLSNPQMTAKIYNDSQSLNGKPIHIFCRLFYLDSLCVGSTFFLLISDDMNLRFSQ